MLHCLALLLATLDCDGIIAFTLVKHSFILMTFKFNMRFRATSPIHLALSFALISNALPCTLDFLPNLPKGIYCAYLSRCHMHERSAPVGAVNFAPKMLDQTLTSRLTIPQHLQVSRYPKVPWGPTAARSLQVLCLSPRPYLRPLPQSHRLGIASRQEPL